MTLAPTAAVALTPAQATLVHLPTAGQFLVRGAAGSGKSTVALARALHLARQPLLHGPARVVLLARAPALAAELARRRDALGGEAARRVEIVDADAWCRAFLAADGVPVAPPLRAHELDLLVGFALELVRRRLKRQVLRRPLAFFTSELRTMLLALGVVRFDDYRAIDREGRALPLDDDSRAAVFAVFEETRALAERVGRGLPLALAPVALQRLAASRTPPYDHVVVDDAHLLAPVELKLVRALAGGGSLTLFSALEQRFDPLAARLSDLGLGRLDRTETLPRALRGPKAICKLALQILRKRVAGDADLAAIVPEAIDGARPRLIVAADWQGEVAALVEELRRVQRDGRPLRDAAVLLPSEREVEFVAAALAHAGIPSQPVRDDDVAAPAATPDAVRLCPLAAAAGREFPLVFLPDVNRGAYPRSKSDLADHERPFAIEAAARSLHLALTRATEEAVLLATGSTLSPLLPRKSLAAT